MFEVPIGNIRISTGGFINFFKIGGVFACFWVLNDGFGVFLGNIPYPKVRPNDAKFFQYDAKVLPNDAKLVPNDTILRLF